MPKLTKTKRSALILALIGLPALLLIGYFTYSLPLAVLGGTDTFLAPKTGRAPVFNWPTYGQAAIGALGYGVLAQHDSAGAKPTASLAKVATVLAILDKKPLALGEPGPTITITAADVAIYKNYLAHDGSVLKVVAGEKLTEYQALQALLLVSANNVADTLATWAFGSISDYLVYANQLAVRLDMSHTHLADASGFSASTVSTAADLVRLGVAALENQLVAQIVGQKQASLPLVGTVKNTNSLLGEQGIIGIKTGNTDQAGGCYLFASRYTLSNHQTLTIVGVVMGAKTVAQAMRDSLSLLAEAKKGFVILTLVPKDQVVGYYNVPWATPAEVVTAGSIKAVVWRGSRLTTGAILQRLDPPLFAGSTIGTLHISNDQVQLSTPLVLKTAIASPSWQWRLLRRKG